MQSHITLGAVMDELQKSVVKEQELLNWPNYTIRPSVLAYILDLYIYWAGILKRPDMVLLLCMAGYICRETDLYCRPAVYIVFSSRQT